MKPTATRVSRSAGRVFAAGSVIALWFVCLTLSPRRGRGSRGRVNTTAAAAEGPHAGGVTGPHSDSGFHVKSRSFF